MKKAEFVGTIEATGFEWNLSDVYFLKENESDLSNGFRIYTHGGIQMGFVSENLNKMFSFYLP